LQILIAHKIRTMPNADFEKLTAKQRFVLMEIADAVKRIDPEDYGHHRLYYGVNRTQPDPGDYGFHFRSGHFIPVVLEDFAALERSGFFEAGLDGRFKSVAITGDGFLIASRKFYWSRESLILNAAFVEANGSDRRAFDAFHVAKRSGLQEEEVAEFLNEQVRKGMLSLKAAIGCYYFNPEGLAMLKELENDRPNRQTHGGVQISISNSTFGAFHAGQGNISGTEQRWQEKGSS
jgi:hypothetical protein